MRPYLFVFLLAWLVMFFAAVAHSCAMPPMSEDVKHVRGLLSGVEFEGYHKLIEMGEGAFSAFESILSDPKANQFETERIFYILTEVKADPRRFLEHAVRRLADPTFDVRLRALQLVGRIGSRAEASTVVALLSDIKKPVAYAAAKALGAIGGPREVIAMDIWLEGVSHRNDAELRQHVRQHRDELKKRLDEAKAKEKS